jgi:SAM-dependent methyltransferase
MDRAERKWVTKEIGLEAGYRLAKFLYGSEHLHYGLFEADIPATIGNLKAAQERYLQRLFELIPAGVRTILDVGCGSGKTAELLIERGYAVDCVSPGTTLTQIAKARLGGRAVIYHDKYETAAIDKRYDLVLFSESFQYIPVDSAITKSISLLNPGGHILICDFFSRAERGRSPIGGGHSFEVWCERYRSYPLDVIVEKDITAETAPVFDIMQAFNTEVAGPLWISGNRAASIRWPFATAVISRLFRKPLAKLERRRLSSAKSSAAFRDFKFYKTYLFKLRTGAAVV